MPLEQTVKVIYGTFPSARHKWVAFCIADNASIPFPPDLHYLASIANTTPEIAETCLTDFIGAGFVVMDDRGGNSRLALNLEYLELLARSCGYFERDGSLGWKFLYDQYSLDDIRAEAKQTRARRLLDEASRYKKAIIPRALRKLVFERDGHCCQHCGAGEHLRVDHIFPEVKGGTLDIDNLQTLCRSCNSKKGTKVPDGAVPQ